MGVSYSEFWHITPRVLNVYIDAYSRHMRHEQYLRDEAAWMHGMYFGKAYGAARSSKVKYPKKPDLVKLEDSKSKGSRKDAFNMLKQRAIAINKKNGYLGEE